MSDSLITIVAILVAAILMFAFPLMSIADRNDDIAQTAVSAAVSDFVNTVRSEGKITEDNYSAFRSKLDATGNAYDIEMEVKVKSSTIGKKNAWLSASSVGSSVYYSEYTAQILERVEGDTHTYPLKEGDIFSVTARNQSSTLAQVIKNAFYSVTGQGTQIVAQSSGVVQSTGN